jgi:hypothetical protein
MQTALARPSGQQRGDQSRNAIPAWGRRTPSPRRDWAGSTLVKLMETVGIEPTFCSSRVSRFLSGVTSSRSRKCGVGREDLVDGFGKLARVVDDPVSACCGELACGSNAP